MSLDQRIELVEVSKSYRDKAAKLEVLLNLSLTVSTGDFLCILGPSGCGKSTLLNLIAGFERPTSGEIKIDGIPISGTNPDYVTVFQDHALFPWRTVLGNVVFGLEMQGIARKDSLERARESLVLVGLADFADFYPAQLSGGMKQRTSIARALAVLPKILFMDEPFGALDSLTRLNLQKDLKAIWENAKMTIVFVTHDVEESTFLGTQIITMSSRPGRISKKFELREPHSTDRFSAERLKLKKEILEEFGVN